MTDNPLSELLGLAPGAFAGAMTWVPPSALRALTFEVGVENEPESLEAIARAFALDLVFVSASDGWAREAVNRLSDARIAAGWTVDGVLTRVTEQRGWSSVLTDSVTRPGELAYALDESLHEALEDVREGIAAGATVLMCADELAGAAGWLVSPDFALDALMPCYRRIAEEWRGGVSVFHSDGDIRALMPSLADAGFGGVHLSSPGHTSLSALVEAARSVRLCPLGGLEVRSLIAEGARTCGARAASLARSGALVIADDGGLDSAESVAAFGAALDVARSMLGADAEG